jgi:hypothetical protein
LRKDTAEQLVYFPGLFLMDRSSRFFPCSVQNSDRGAWKALPLFGGRVTFYGLRPEFQARSGAFAPRKELQLSEEIKSFSNR